MAKTTDDQPDYATLWRRNEYAQSSVAHLSAKVRADDAVMTQQRAEIRALKTRVAQLERALGYRPLRLTDEGVRALVRKERLTVRPDGTYVGPMNFDAEDIGQVAHSWVRLTTLAPEGTLTVAVPNTWFTVLEDK